MTLSITLIGGPTALIEIDGFRSLGFGSRLKMLAPGVPTRIQPPG
jgi:hypothetical protein